MSIYDQPSIHSPGPADLVTLNETRIHFDPWIRLAAIRGADFVPFSATGFNRWLKDFVPFIARELCTLKH